MAHDAIIWTTGRTTLRAMGDDGIGLGVCRRRVKLSETPTRAAGRGASAREWQSWSWWVVVQQTRPADHAS